MNDNFDTIKDYFRNRMNDVFANHPNLVLGDIHEQNIYNEFFDLGFGTRYKNSGRKSRYPIFLRDDFQRTVLRDYFNSLSKSERHAKIKELYNYLSHKEIF